MKKEPLIESVRERTASAKNGIYISSEKKKFKWGVVCEWGATSRGVRIDGAQVMLEKGKKTVATSGNG